MRLEASCHPSVHLTYCLNIHRGEHWSENLQAIKEHACAVRDAVAGTQPFGLGLRLSALAATELMEPGQLDDFREFLAAHNLYVFTINGFPFGPFHGTRVKADVYAPDWRTDARVNYTLRLAEILGVLLPAEMEGSISTVPGTYRTWAGTADDRIAVVRGLARAVMGLHALHKQTGRKVRLALEPEPDCLWDTTGHMIDLFRKTLPAVGTDLLVAESGLPRDQAQQLWQDYLGVCFDTCHQAVMFAGVVQGLRDLQEAGIPIAKIQISAAPRCETTPEALAELVPFVDPVYLHQSFVKDADGVVTRYADLPEALSAAATLERPGELRTHFHIPLCVAGHGSVGSTRSELGTPFFELLRGGICAHLEVETYTFDVLPEALRTRGVVASVADELGWVLSRFGSGCELIEGG